MHPHLRYTPSHNRFLYKVERLCLLELTNCYPN
jgi:hypothetical protein